MQKERWMKKVTIHIIIDTAKGKTIYKGMQ